jgi:hypothetical protein
MTTRTQTDDDDDKIAKDGQTVRVPMMLLDAQQRKVAVDTIIKDAIGKSVSTVGHRPGGLAVADADVQRRHALHMTYDAMISQRWRSPQVTANQSDAERPTGDARLCLQ